MSDNLPKVSKSITEEAMWDSLPHEILTHVFLRLPIKSIITCTSVSKTPLSFPLIFTTPPPTTTTSSSSDSALSLSPKQSNDWNESETKKKSTLYIGTTILISINTPPLTTSLSMAKALLEYSAWLVLVMAFVNGALHLVCYKRTQEIKFLYHCLSIPICSIGGGYLLWHLGIPLRCSNLGMFFTLSIYGCWKTMQMRHHGPKL